MKKFVPHIIGGLLGIVLSGLIQAEGLGEDRFFLSFAFGMIAILLSYFVHIIIHEAGHLLFGLLSGYRFLSFRIASFMWQRSSRGISFYRFSIPGTGGQCLMAPPVYREDGFPFVLYNLGGSLTNLLSALLVYGFMRSMERGTGLRLALIIFVVLGIFTALTNAIPIRAGMIVNDGYNILSMRRERAARRAFWIQLAVQEALVDGTRLREMPAAWFELPTQKEMENHMISYLAVIYLQRLIDEGRFTEAREEALRLLADGSIALELYQYLIRLDLIYLALLEGSSPEEAMLHYGPDIERFMKMMPNYPAIIRNAYVIALFVDKDEEKAGQFEAKMDTIKARYPYPVEIEGELQLIAAARQAYENRRGLEEYLDKSLETNLNTLNHD